MIYYVWSPHTGLGAWSMVGKVWRAWYVCSVKWPCDWHAAGEESRVGKQQGHRKRKKAIQRYD